MNILRLLPLLLLCSPLLSQGQPSVDLAWDPPINSTPAGYRIYYGPASRTYTNRIDVGLVTSTRVCCLVPGARYFFAATAYKSTGEESVPSGEFVYKVPDPDALLLPPINDVALLPNTTGNVPFTVALGRTALSDLVVTASSSDTNLLPNAAISIGGTGTNLIAAVRPTAGLLGAATVVITVVDRADPTRWFSEAFTVSIASLATASTMNAIANRSIAEDSPLQTVGLSGISSPLTGAGGSLRVTASSSNPSLIPHPVVNYSSPNTTGSLTFTPVPNIAGMATITVSLRDAATGVSLVTRTFNVSVWEVNDAPTLNPLANLALGVSAAKQVVSLSGIGTGAPNEQQALTVTATSSNPAFVPQPTVAYLSPGPSGTVSFTPVPNVTGSTTITVTVNDGQSFNNLTTRSFVVAVGGVGGTNTPPSFDAIANRAIAEDSALQTVSLSRISAAGGNATARITAVSSNPSLVPNPKVNYIAPNTSGSLTFTPVPNASGSATIRVTLDDGLGTATSTLVRSFTVSVWDVNDVPTLNPLANVTLAPSAGAQVINLSGITSGAANEVQVLSLSASTSDSTLIKDLAVTYQSGATSGLLTFTPIPWSAGTATLTVSVNDGQSFNNLFSRTMQVTLDGSLGAPSVEPIANLSLAEDSVAQTVAVHYSAGDGMGIGALLSASSSDAALIPNPVSVTVVSNGLALVSFQPVTNASGQATITVTLDDGRGLSNSVAAQAFRVTVAEVNDPPTLNPLSNRTITQDSAVHTITLNGITAGPSNEVQTVAINAISSNPSCIPNPVVSYSPPATSGTLILTPVPGSEGSSTITLTVNDGQSTNGTLTRIFNVKVEPAAGAPTLDAITSLKLPEDAGVQTVNLTGISSPYRGTGSTMSITATSSNPSLIPPPTVVYASGSTTGRVMLAPLPNAAGLANVSVTLRDSANPTNIVVRTFSVSVWDVNDLPTLDPIAPITISEDAEAQTVALTGISSGDIGQSQPLSFRATSGNPSLIPHPTVTYQNGTATGSLVLVPRKDMSGSAVITVSLSDGQSINSLITRSFLVTVLATNDPPTIDPLTDLTIDEDAPVQGVALGGIGAGAFDESDPVTVVATSSDPSLIPDPTVVYEPGSQTGVLLFAPLANAFGEAFIQLTVSDGQAANGITLRTFKVTVLSVEDPPTLDGFPDLVLDEDAPPQTLELTGISGGPANETNALTITARSSNPGVVADPVVSYFDGDGIGSLVLTPVSQVSGVAFITVTVSDGSDPTNDVVRAFQVTVNPVNDTPLLDEIADVSLYADEGSVNLTLRGIQSGALDEADVLVVSAVSSDPLLMANPTVEYASPDASGTLRLTPFPDRSGVVQITVSVDDGQPLLNRVERTFTVNILPAPTNSVFVEAESGLLTEPMVVGVHTNASNGAFVYSAVAEQGELTLAVDIPRAGNYAVWARVQPPDGATQLLHFRLDGGAEITCVTTNVEVPAVLHWVRLADDASGQPQPFQLSQGAHELHFRNLETNVIFDAVFLTTDLQATPPDSLDGEATGGGVESIPPYPWLVMAIGSPSSPGSARFVDGIFKIRGAGQIGGSADSFQFVHQSLNGDGVITAKLSSANGSGTPERIGLMIRQDLTEQSAYIFLGTSGNGDLVLQGRDASGTELSPLSWSLTAPPAIWLQLSREGDTYYAFAQVDGVAWQLLATVTLPLNPDLHFGMAVASEDPQNPAIPTFSGVIVEP